ncbi:DNA mismatch repair protein MutL [Orbus hercynius]|uniref:DNA mismatch repair protein MutL n=1 Tax=Orbus hercynius TaxID=593135 RepID=A0A495RBC7_9GAMM|nr:DNA mismatch repair endonuclease MutL [Orbus hercynius]RKS84484.1 DNA mismatch repair protein MutL [Orbus hercynius]
MAIQILPPQLANQIAAGEVVERPASIIKELVENSIDAGATRIDIDIEQGGCKLIRIRDNGCGIAKDELSLALARHATSKIHCLDDLEAIMSLGFRGEALASISSVSRLTLTSKTQSQSEGWQVYAEGRDMSAVVKPAAHPQGTTVEVLDIFYNTPARRRFLKTEKTEFSHIDEVVRRIALACPHVNITLQHNGKPVRLYRAVQADAQIEKRVASICGMSFMKNAMSLSWQHDDLSIHGWIAPHAKQEHVQYFYVNGRIVKDRLLNHALKQAFLENNSGGTYTTDELLGYVIHLNLDPHQVDVNVHPAKHEVRFHEARLVHDFVYQAVAMALTEHHQTLTFDSDENAADCDSWMLKPNRTAAGDNVFNVSPAARTTGQSFPPASLQKTTHAAENDVYRQLIHPVGESHVLREEQISVSQQAVIQSLFPKREQPLSPIIGNIELASAVRLGRVLTIIHNEFALLEKNEYQQQTLSVLSLKKAQLALFKHKIASSHDDLHQEHLLIPLSLLLNKHEQHVIEQAQPVLKTFNFDCHVEKSKLQLNAVPKLMRKANWQALLPDLIEFLSLHLLSAELKSLLYQWLIEQYTQSSQEQNMVWSVPQTISLLMELEQLSEHDLTLSDMLKPVDLSLFVSLFLSESL